MPMPERLRRQRTLAELAHEERIRRSALQRALGKRRGPKPVSPLAELKQPIDTTAVPPLRSKMLRHTYCAARIQTTDNGKAISLYTVARELGHNKTKMVENVYAHLGQFRYRGESVEYRW
jgi:integrase